MNEFIKNMLTEEEIEKELKYEKAIREFYRYELNELYKFLKEYEV